MGISLLIIAILLYVSILVIFRFFEKYGINNSHAIIANYFTAAVFSLIIYDGNINLSEIITPEWFLPASILGILFMLAFLLFAVSTQKAGVAITAVASKMSVVIPVLAGTILYEYEKLSTLKIIGLLLAMASFYFIFKDNSGKKIKSTILILLPLSIFLFSGINDVLLKYIREIYFKGAEININNEILFMSVLFSVSFISSLLLYGSISVYKKVSIKTKSIIGGIILGLFNFFSALSMFKAMAFFESAIFFPIFNISIVCLSALVGIVFFKEKASKINIIGFGLATITILLLAFINI